jgi:hypothetical protein
MPGITGIMFGLYGLLLIFRVDFNEIKLVYIRPNSTNLKEFKVSIFMYFLILF